MASTLLPRRSQPAPSLQPNSHPASSMAVSRSGTIPPANDPLQPLRAMADRVGKEVEKFAERVDHWHTHGTESDTAKYHTTVKLVDHFRDLAESTVRDLKKKNTMDNQGALDKSVRRRIKGLANDDGQRLFAESTRSIVPSIEPSAASESPSVRELRHWQAELATWELLRVVIDHHHHEPDTDVAAKKATRLASVGGTSRYSPKEEVWDRFVIEDDAAREKKVILKWLQETARNTESDIESIIDQWGTVSGKDTNTWTSGWLDTKAKIKQAKRMQGIDRPLDQDHTIQVQGSVTSLVTRLDPDGPNRQKRALEKSDDYYENALWMVCYEMLRRGEPWEKISEWCKERSEAWRGVSIGASYATHPDGGPNVAGSDLGYLFRRMCFYASRGAKLPYEGAVYALLSGDVKRVHETCHSWDDHLYAHYNALLLSRFDRYLRQNPQPHPWVSDKTVLDFVFMDEASNVDHWETSNQQVIELLMRNAATSEEAKTPMKLIQGALISGTIEDLLYKVGVAIADMFQDDERPSNLILDPDTADLRDPTSKKATEHRRVSAEPYHQTLAKDPHALRLLVHICIIFREGFLTIDWEDNAAAFAMQNVIAAYIELLRITKRTQLIPLYAAQLSHFRAHHCLCRILPDIKNSEEQKLCVTLMREYRVAEIEVVCLNFERTLLDCGLVRKSDFNSPNPIARFGIVEKWTGKDAYLWPGLRIQKNISGFDITPKEEALLESLQWFGHLDAEYEKTFEYLEKVLTALLLNGRMGAAHKLVTELSVETISLVKTTALCGYAFDFTQVDAEQQDEDQVAEALRHSSSGNDSARPSDIPSAEEHAAHVQSLREASQTYFALSQLVRLIAAFREWRTEEETLITQREASQPVSTKRAKELLITIEATYNTILDPEERVLSDPYIWPLYRAYYPDVTLAYLSVLLSGSFFIHRDSATKAMDLATEVADQEREWLQQAFIQSGKMSDLVDALAYVSRAMLKLGEHDIGKPKPGKKRGSRGETLRIWDVNVRN